MTPRLRTTLQAAEWVFFRVILLLLLLLPVGALYLQVSGVPTPLADRVLAWVGPGAFTVDAERVRVDWLRGVICEDARLYRRGVIGPPGAEAEIVELHIGGLVPWGEHALLRSVVVRRGIVRPFQAMSPDDAPEGEVPSTSWAGRVALDDVHVQGVDIVEASSRVRLHEGVFTFERLRGTLTRSTMRGSFDSRLIYDMNTDMLRGRVTLLMNPVLVLPVLEAWELEGLSELVQRFQFEGAYPQAELGIRYHCVDDGRLEVDGTVNAREGTYRGVSFRQVNTTLHAVDHMTNQVVMLSPLTVMRDDGRLRGDLRMDLFRGIVRFDAEATTDPQHLRTMLDVLPEPFWDRWRFEGPVRIQARGLAGMEDDAHHDFVAVVTGHRGFYQDYRFDDFAFKSTMHARTNVLSEIDIAAYGGTITGGARFVVATNETGNTAFDVVASARDMAFERVIEALVGDAPREYSGTFSMDVTLRGLAGTNNLHTLQGEGLANVDEGRVFLLPVFGGLSDLLARIIPGLDFVLRQSDAQVAFDVKNRQVICKKLKVEGGVLSLSGRGIVSFDRTADFHVQIRLMKEHQLVAKLLRLITYPITKLFEFRLRGSLDDPDWYPVNFSSDLLERIGLKERSP